jgi:hypothetical protein
MTDKKNTSRFPLLVFIWSACVLSFGLGMGVAHYRVFPYSLFEKAKAGYEELTKIPIRNGKMQEKKLLWFYNRISRPLSVKDGSEAAPGINLVTRVSDRLNLAAELRDLNGKVLHSWSVNWFDIWPDAEHVPPHVKPKSPPGTHIHGATLLPDGNLVFNYEHLGTVCLDPASRVVWKLPYRTHHSIQRSADGNLWICAQKTHTESDPDFPFRDVPFDEYMILVVSPDGNMLHEWSVDRILKENGQLALLTENKPGNNTAVYNDILHLNDAEPFPVNMEPGFFGPGDVMVSLRNISTVFVFNQHTRKIKYISKPGMFSCQHDPDFVDGNTFSVFDNNVFSPFKWAPDAQSRILIISASDNSADVVYEGTPEHPFFTRIMGKHQWLENGHLLVTESIEGRAWEIDPQGNMVWEWINQVGQNIVGLVEQVDRIPEGMLHTIRERMETEEYHEM